MLSDDMFSKIDGLVAGLCFGNALCWWLLMPYPFLALAYVTLGTFICLCEFVGDASQ